MVNTSTWRNARCTAPSLTRRRRRYQRAARAAGRAIGHPARQLSQLPISPDRSLDAICVGAAGNVPGTREFWYQRLAPLTRSGVVVIVTDAMLVLPAAGLEAGIAVICGTGSIAVGCHAGRTARAGGWGYLLGDEGSGYWIVRAAIRTLLDRRDLAAPAGTLGERLLAAAGAADVDALAQLFYGQPQPRHWAGYAPAVLDSCDPAVGPLVSSAARALAALAVSTAERLGSAADLPVTLAGGLIRHPALSAAVRSELADALPGSQVTVLRQPPVAGAVRLAEAAAPT